MMRTGVVRRGQPVLGFDFVPVSLLCMSQILQSMSPYHRKVPESSLSFSRPSARLIAYIIAPNSEPEINSLQPISTMNLKDYPPRFSIKVQVQDQTQNNMEFLVLVDQFRCKTLLLLFCFLFHC